MDWGFRKQLIPQEFQQFQPDLLVLEEVDKPEFYQSILDQDSFALNYFQKSQSCEGQLIGVNKKKFKMLK